MKIKDLQHPYKEMALINQERQGNERDEEKELNTYFVEGGFFWSKTTEGAFFWINVNKGESPEITPEIKANYPEVFGEGRHDDKCWTISNEPEPKYGDTVWVRDYPYESWMKRFFIDLTGLDFCKAVHKQDEVKFNTGLGFKTYTWRYYRTTDPAKDKKVLELTKEEIAEKLGVDSVIIKND